MKEKQRLLLSSILILVMAVFAFVVVAIPAEGVSETLTATPSPSPPPPNQTISPKVAVGATFVILLAFALLIVIGVLADRKLNRGEMRRAIAGTFVVGFTMLMILSLTYDCSYRREIVMMYIELVSIIIGFYFGSRAVAEKKESETMEEEKTPEQISIENVQFTEKSDKIFNIIIRNSGAFEATVDRVYIDNEPKQIEKVTISPKSTKDLSIKHEWEKGKNYKIKVATTEGTIIEKEEAVS